MADSATIQILPYTCIVGQEQLKLALELAYIAPRIGGVLISGHRGTAKSTAVRAFAQMMYGRLPVTLPINATEDRIIGGWRIDELMRGHDKRQQGLLEDAHGAILYVDEVNLLEDHIVNLILDAASTGVLVVQREGQSEQKQVSFTLVGTMNPEEGWLRPQLRDRFGLMVDVKAEKDPKKRAAILKTVLDFDRALAQLRAQPNGPRDAFLEAGLDADQKRRAEIEQARAKVGAVVVKEIVDNCVAVGKKFDVEGHRGDFVTVLAAQAYAALKGAAAVTNEHVAKVAPLALQHRRPEAAQSRREFWTDEDTKALRQILQLPEPATAAVKA